MADYASLSPEQQKIVDDLLLFVRPTNGHTQKVLNECQFIVDLYKASAKEVLDLLDDNAVIPNKTGLAGAGEVEKSDLVENIALMTQMLGILNTDEKRQMRTLMAGKNAL